ncbi:MAG: VacJ family lipoprotein [Alphaproteobacteria bacterium]|nr:VacJ family lipoprotein [Alphaproteobacteria bacterium]
MNYIFTILLSFFLLIPSVRAQEDAYSYMDTDEYPGEVLEISPEEFEELLHPPSDLADNDPFESINRVTFGVNNFLDDVLLDPVSAMYVGVVPEFLRERVGYFLRNLSEPIVLVNNILQGEMQDAEDTLRRFAINSTVGLGGILDVSTDLDIPYKREDFGLTLASWGFEEGPYIVLPILGPSNLRDTIGRIGDYGFDSINWWAYFTDDNALYSYTRTAAQVLDSRSDNIDIIKDLKENSLDPYGAFRTWYTERRRNLSSKNEGRIIETAQPEDEDEEVLEDDEY